MIELEVPDKLSIATYLISYYNYFKDKKPATPNILPQPTQDEPVNKNTPPYYPQQHANKPTTATVSNNKPMVKSNNLRQTSSTPAIKPLLTKTVSDTSNSSPLLHKSASSSSAMLPQSTNATTNNTAAVSKLSEGILKLQRKEMSRVPASDPTPAAMPLSPVKKPLVPVSPVDSTHSPTSATPSKFGARGRKQKFSDGNTEKESNKSQPATGLTTAGATRPPKVPIPISVVGGVLLFVLINILYIWFFQ